MWDTADEHSFALINRVRYMWKKSCPNANKKYLHKAHKRTELTQQQNT